MSPPVATLVVALPLIGLLGVAVLRTVDERLLLKITNEDGWLEWSQFVAFAGAAVLSGGSAIRFFRANNGRFLAVAYGWLALALLFVAGEEIAWGQRLLGFHAPEPFASHNAELTFHNLDEPYVPFNRLQLVAGLYGSLVPLIVRLVPGARRPPVWELLMPPLFLIPAFACVSGIGLARVVDDFDPTGMTYNEWAEFCFGFGLAVFAALVWRRLGRRRCRPPLSECLELRRAVRRPSQDAPRRITIIPLEQGLKRPDCIADATPVCGVIMLKGAVLGHVLLHPTDLSTAESVAAAIPRELGDRLWLPLIQAAFERAARGPEPRDTADRPAVSVVIDAGDQPERLGASIEGVLSLTTPACEILVADDGSAPSVRSQCDAFPVRRVAGSHGGRAEALNRAVQEASAELVGLTTAACVPDPGWLDSVGRRFSDRLLMAVSGYVGLSGRGAACRRQPGPVVIDGAFALSPVRAAASLPFHANVVIRRGAFSEAGPFLGRIPFDRDGAAGPGTYLLYRLLAAGLRIGFDPAQVVWRTDGSPRGVRPRPAESRYALLCLLEDRDPDALRLLAARVRGAVGLRAGEPSSREPARRALADRRPSPAPASSAAPGAPLTLSVVVPSHDRAGLLRQVLEALAHQDYPADAFEVIVVLDGSSDESAELAARASTPYRLRILEQRRTGTAAARNRGAREAASPLLVFLDDDIIPEPQFLSEHARAHADGHPQRVALGACPSAPLGRGRWGRMQRAWWENHFARKGDPDLPWTAIEASMGNSSLPRSFLEACGGFDERFARRNEDVELGARLIGAGASFAYRPQARGAHVLDGTLKTALMRHREQAYYDVLLIRKHPELRSRVAAAAYASDSPAGVSRAAAAAYRHAAVLAPLQPLALAAAALLEGLRMRRTFDALAGRLMAQSYMAGLRRAPGTAESFAELMAWIRAEPEARLSLELGAPGPLEVPAGIGRASLAITHGPKTLAEVQLMEPGRDWSWDELTTRAASELLGPVRSSMPLEELIRMAAPDDSTPASGGRSA